MNGKNLPPLQHLKIGDIFYDPSPAHNHSQGTIFPSEDKIMWVELNQSLAPSIDSVTKGTSIFYIWGKIEYKDTFKQPHWTHLCYVLDKTLKSASACDIYNDSDAGEQGQNPN